MKTAFYDSPIGLIRYLYSDSGLCELQFLNDHEKSQISDDPLVMLDEELDAYFAGDLREFQTPIVAVGTDFQKSVWNALPKYGKTISYMELAKQLGDEGAVRAVANANARNLCMILTPCHRVIGTDGSLTGYAGGIERKRKLIELEKGITQTAIF